MNGFKFIYKNSPTNAGGTGMYLSLNIKYINRPDLEFDFEGCETKFVELTGNEKKSTHSKNIIVGSIYRHPHDNHQTFFAKLGKTLELTTSKYCVIIIGDINIDVNPSNKNQYAKEYNDLLLSFGCLNLINKPTRIDNSSRDGGSRTTLDHLITNTSLGCVDPGILEYDVSDHLPIFGAFKMDIDKQKIKYPQLRFHYPSKKPEFLKKLRENLSNSDLHADSKDAVLLNATLDNIIKALLNAEESVFPLKKLSRKQAKARRKPWITGGIIKSIRHRHILFRQQLRKNDAELTKYYKKYRNKLNRTIENAKANYLKDVFDKIGTNPRKAWSELNKLFKRGKSNSGLPPEILVEGSKVSDPISVAESLNKHFATKGHKLASELPQPSISVMETMGTESSQAMNFKEIDKTEIENFIKHNTKSVLIKWGSPVLSPILTTLYQSFIDIGSYPDIFKIAKVTALHKGGSISDLDNYRPISVLSHLNKILEKLIDVRLRDFMDEHSLFTNAQFGFRKGHSTSHGITKLHDKIIESLEKKMICAVLFIDLKSAFDTIDHCILAKKLKHIGIKGNILQLLISYLENRKQFIKSDDIITTLVSVLCGVPQGSILGPLLFVIYINDFANCSKLNSILFADDAAIVHEHKSLKHLQKQLNSEADKLNQWFIANKLTLNLKKTKLMLFNKQKLKPNALKKFKLNINKTNIEQVDQIKYLGVILDNKLNWHSHIEYMCTKLSRAAGVIFKMRNILPRRALLMIYNSLGASYLRYGVMSWGTARTTALAKLKVLQNKIIRYITHSPLLTNVTAQYRLLSILNVHQLLTLETAKFMFKQSKSQLPKAFDEHFPHINHTHQTRTKRKAIYSLLRPRTDLGKRSTKFFAIKLWSEVDEEVKNIDKIDTFNAKIKSMLLSGSFNPQI